MASVVKKTTNALSQESTLLNVHADLKAVSGKFDTLVSTIESANKRVLNWAERSENERIQEFLRAVYDLEAEKAEVDKHFNDNYKLFVKLWKGIISEKKELNSQLKALDSARSSLRDKTKKVSRAEQKEPQHKVEQRMTELEDAKNKEAQVASDVAQKLLEVQKDKHQSLRTGYTGLYSATMSRLKKHVEVQEKMRELVNAFPNVVARNEDGTYEFEPCAQNQEQDVWWQGEQLQKMLRDIKGQHDEEKRVIHKQHTAKLDELIKRNQQMSESMEKARRGDLSGMAKDHEMLIANMKQNHADQVQDLNDQRAQLEEEQARALVACDEKYAELESILRSSGADGAARLLSVQDELKAQQEAYRKLQENLDTTQRNIVIRSRKGAADQIAHAAIGAKQSSMNTFLEVASQVRNSAEAIALLLQDDLEGKHDIVDVRISTFAAGVSSALISAAGAAQFSQAETSMELVDDLQPAAAAATAILSKFAVVDPTIAKATSDTSARVESEVPSPDPAPTPAQVLDNQVLALYKHEGKVQDGFSLIGFAKGDVLTLVKRREDGWSRVRSIDGGEGWAPSSYLQDHVPEPTPAAEAVPEASGGGSEGGGGSNSEEDPRTPAELVGVFVSVFDKAILTAKRIQTRDRELQKLANQTVGALDDKVSAAQQSIMDANTLFTRLLAQSKATDSDRTLEVNTQLLETCLKLETAMERVINSAEGMRTALMRSKGSQSDGDFNTKHQSWFEALSGSVDAVHEGNPMLTEAVRSVLAGKGKHEELQVASRNITASVAQLSSLSRTKSMADTKDQGSQNNVSKNCAVVIETGTQLLAATRESQDLALASVLMADFTNLSANQAKRLTMATQVNVLKIEKDLENEREKLGRLRRLTYKEG